MALSAGREKNGLEENTHNIEGSLSWATFFARKFIRDNV